MSERTYGSAGDVRVLCETLMVCKNVEERYDRRLEAEDDQKNQEAEKGEKPEDVGDESRDKGKAKTDKKANKENIGKVVNAQEACVTVVDLEIPFITPIHHMKLPYTPCPGKFQVRAKIRSVFPGDVKGWTRPFCDLCESSENIKGSKDGKSYRCTTCGTKGRYFCLVCVF